MFISRIMNKFVLFIVAVSSLCSIRLSAYCLLSEYKTSTNESIEKSFLRGNNSNILLNIKPQFKKEFILKDGSTVFLVSNDGKNYGVITSNGKELVPQRYEFVEITENLIFCVKSNGTSKKICVLYNNKGVCKISEDEKVESLKFYKRRGKLYATNTVSFDVCNVYNEKGDKVYKYKILKDSNGFKYMISELDGSVIIKPGKFTGINFYEGDIKIEIDNKVGIMDIDGTEIIPATQYRHIMLWNNSGYKVHFSTNGRGMEGYLDINGKCVFPAVNYTDIYPIKNGVFEVRSNGKSSIADSLGNIIFTTKYSRLELSKDEDGSLYYKTYLGNGRGKMSLDGKIIEEPQPSKVKKEIKKGNYTYLEVVGENGLCGVENSKGKIIIPCEYEYIIYDDDIPGYKLIKYGYQGIANIDGKIIIPCNKYNFVYTPWREKNEPLYFHVEYLGKEGLCDSLGNEVVKPLFNNVDLPNSNGTYNVKYNHREGVIDASDKIVVPFEYDYIKLQEDGKYQVTILGKKGLCDENGKIIIPLRYKSIEKMVIRDEIFKEIYKVKDEDGTVGLFTSNGRMVFPTGLFKIVFLYKNGKILSTDPADKIYGHLNGLLKAVESSAYNIDDTFLGDNLYVQAFNNFNEGLFYFYDIKGNLIYDTRKEKKFDEYFKLGQNEFEKQNYKQAINYYKQAAEIKETGVTYYNIGVSYYNIDKYKDAIANLRKCINLNPRQNIIDKANDLIVECNIFFTTKKKKEN